MEKQNAHDAAEKIAKMRAIFFRVVMATSEQKKRQDWNLAATI